MPMNELTRTALRTLPAWAGYSALVFYVLSALLLSILAARAGAAITLRPLRALERTLTQANLGAPPSSPTEEAESLPAIANAAYAERARLAYPVRVFSGLCASLVPVALSILAMRSV